MKRRSVYCTLLTGYVAHLHYKNIQVSFTNSNKLSLNPCRFRKLTGKKVIINQIFYASVCQRSFSSLNINKLNISAAFLKKTNLTRFIIYYEYYLLKQQSANKPNMLIVKSTQN